MKARRRRCFSLALVAVATHASLVLGQAGVTAYHLTLEQALELARSRAPAVRGAQARVAEASARLVGASVRFRDNPELEVGGGPRSGGEGTSHDLEVALRQSLELGGKRRARIDAATAELDAATASEGDRLRVVLREVAVAFLRARHGEERLRVAREVEELTVALSSVASSRYDSGDVGIVDVNVAAVAGARAEAEVRKLGAFRARALGDLRILLGLPGDAEVTVTGEILERRRYELSTLLSRASGRPDLRSIEASLRGVEAEARLAKAHAWPDLGFAVGYAREERADIVTGGVMLSLPVFESGQGLRAAAQARGDRLRLELEVGRGAIDAEIRTAFIVYQGLVQAVDQFEGDGLPRIESTDELARLSYEAGAISLGELLTARRELVEARVVYTDLLLDAALAGIDVEAAAGLLQ